MSSNLIKSNIKKLMSILLIAMLIVGLIPAPASVFGAGDLEVKTGTDNTQSLDSVLTDGAISTAKNVVDKGNGEFEITLKAIGQDYKVTNTKPPVCLDVVLVLDTSESMSHDGKLRSMKDAAKNAVDTLLGVPGNRVAVVNYCGLPNELSGFTTDKGDLKNKIEYVEWDDWTNIQYAFYTAHQMINNRTDKKNKPVIILMSDGEPTVYHDRLTGLTEDNITDIGGGDRHYIMYTIKQAMEAKKAGIDIYTIGFGVGDNSEAVATLQPTDDNTSAYRDKMYYGNYCDKLGIEYRSYYRDYNKKTNTYGKWKSDSHPRTAAPGEDTTTYGALKTYNSTYTKPSDSWNGDWYIINNPINVTTFNEDGDQWQEAWFEWNRSGVHYDVEKGPEPFDYKYWAGSAITSSDADALMNAFVEIINELITYKPMTYITGGAIKNYSDVVITDEIGDGFDLVGFDNGTTPAGVTVSGKTVTWRINGNTFPTMDAGSTSVDPSKVSSVKFTVKLKDGLAENTYKTNKKAESSFNVPDQNPKYADTSILQTLMNHGWVTLKSLPKTVTVKVTKNVTGPVSGDHTFNIGLYSDQAGNTPFMGATPVAITINGSGSKTVERTFTVPSSSFDSKGNLYIYAIEKDSAPAHWTYDNTPQEIKISKSCCTGEATITNTYAPKGTLTIEKKWPDGVPQGVTSVAINVLKEKEGSNGTQWDLVLQGLQLSDGKQWKETVTGLELGAKYSVQETIVPKDYAVEYSPSTVTFGEGSLEQTITITNKYVQPKGHITITKKWNDTENAAGFRPSEVNFKYNDPISNEENIFTVKASQNWTNTLETTTFGAYTFKEIVPKDYTSANAEQTAVIQIDGERNASLEFTNHYATPSGILNVTKKWEDNQNSQGFRPGKIVMKLIQWVMGDSGETPVESQFEMTGDQYADEWIKTFDNLAFGKYSIVEMPTVDDYDTTSSAIDVTLDIGTLGHTDSRSGDITVTNTFKNPKGSITVDKKWAEASQLNAAECRPAQIKVSLMKGDTEVDSVILPKTTSESAVVWDHTFGNLPLDGSTYTVTESALDSNDIQKLEKYSKKVVYGGDAGSNDGITINRENRTGTATLQNTNANGTITINKNWVDKNNPVNERPQKVDIKLIMVKTEIVSEDISREISVTDPETGVTTTKSAVETVTKEAITEQEIGEANLDRDHLTHTFYDLEMGENISYYAREEAVPAFYDCSYSNAGNVKLSDTFPNGIITVTNTYKDPKGSIEVIKVWKHGNSPSRPDAVIDLYKVGQDKPIDSKTISSSGSSCKFENLDLGSQYYVREQFVNDYHTDYGDENYTNESKAYVPQKGTSDVAGVKVTITNQYIPAKGSLQVVKKWEGTTGGAIKAIITRSCNNMPDSDFSAELELNEENGWKNTKNDLDVYGPGGNLYTYQVTESGDDLFLYTSKITETPTLAKDETATVTITNTYAPNRGTLTIKKEWGGENNNAPVASVAAVLCINDVPQETAVVLSAPDWSVTLANQNLASKYSISEVNVPEGYEPRYSDPVKFTKDHLSGTLTITNVWVPPYIDLIVDKDVMENNTAFLDENGQAVFNYRIRVMNSVESNRTVNDVYVIDKMIPTNGAINTSFEYLTSSAVNADGTATFNLTSPLKPGESAEIYYQMKMTKAGRYDNTAVAYGTAGNEKYSSEEARERVTVKPAGLGIVKSVVGPSTITGNSGTFTYNLRVENTSDNNLFDVTVKDVMTLNGANAVYSYNGELPYDSDNKVFTIGDMTPGAVVVIPYTVAIDRTGSYDNTATVTGYYYPYDNIPKFTYQKDFGRITLTDSDDATVSIAPYIAPPVEKPNKPGRNTSNTVIPDELIPEAPVPAAPIVETPADETILDDQIPKAPLPKTGGLPAILLYGAGALLAGGGLILRRKDKNNK